jgi:SWIRM domain/Myb-like DNA-binding domain/SWIRM-associated region 1
MRQVPTSNGVSITKLPKSLFYDTSKRGAYVNVVSFFVDNLIQHNNGDMHKPLDMQLRTVPDQLFHKWMAVMWHQLLSNRVIALPRIEIDARFDVSLRETLAKIVNRMGATLVSRASVSPIDAKTSHFISAATPMQDLVRPGIPGLLQVRTDAALIHWSRYPSTYDVWVSKDTLRTLPNVRRDPSQVHASVPGAPRYVSPDWLLMTDKFNEWMNAADFLVDTKTASTAGKTVLNSTATATSALSEKRNSSTVAAQSIKPVSTNTNTAAAVAAAAAATTTATTVAIAGTAAPIPANSSTNSMHKTVRNQVTKIGPARLHSEDSIRAAVQRNLSSVHSALAVPTALSDAMPTNLHHINPSKRAATMQSLKSSQSNKRTRMDDTAIGHKDKGSLSTPPTTTTTTNAAPMETDGKDHTSLASVAVAAASSASAVAKGTSTAELPRFFRNGESRRIQGSTTSNVHDGLDVPPVQLLVSRVDPESSRSSFKRLQSSNSATFLNISRSIQPEPPAKSFPFSDRLAPYFGVSPAQRPVLEPVAVRGAKWFDRNSIHNVERWSVCDSLQAASGIADRSDKFYMQLRNEIVDAYHARPWHRLSLRECRLLVPGHEVMLAVIHAFLEDTGVINAFCTIGRQAKSTPVSFVKRTNGRPYPVLDLDPERPFLAAAADMQTDTSASSSACAAPDSDSKIAINGIATTMQVDDDNADEAELHGAISNSALDHTDPSPGSGIIVEPEFEFPQVTNQTRLAAAADFGTPSLKTLFPPSKEAVDRYTDPLSDMPTYTLSVSKLFRRRMVLSRVGDANSLNTTNARLPVHLSHNMTSSAPASAASASSSSLPPSSISDDKIAAFAMGQVKCASCARTCVKIRYVLRQHPTLYNLCSMCFANGRFPSIACAEDFERIHVDQYPLWQHGPASVRSDFLRDWKPQETARLLKAIGMYKDDWTSITECVRTRSRDECMLRFLQMPLEDAAVEQHDNELGVTLNGSAHQSAASSSEDLLWSRTSSYRKETSSRMPFEDTANPLMSQIAFIAHAVSPQIASSAARAAMLDFANIEQNACRDFVSTRFGNGILLPQKPNDMDEDAVDVQLPYGVLHTRRQHIKPLMENPDLPDDMSPLEIAAMAISKHPFPRPSLDTADMKAVCHGALIAAATKAKQLAQRTELQLMSQTLNMVHLQSQKVKEKMKKLRVLDSWISKEMKNGAKSIAAIHRKTKDIASKQGLEQYEGRWRVARHHRMAADAAAAAAAATNAAQLGRAPFPQGNGGMRPL